MIDCAAFVGHFDARYGSSSTTGSGLAVLLDRYAWKKLDFEQTTASMRDSFEEGARLAEALRQRGAWSSVEMDEAREWAVGVLKWGGVYARTRVPTIAQLEVTLRNALDAEHPFPKAPMNSSYTKLATVATHHLEDDPAGLPHVIWDSRVALSALQAIETSHGARLRDPKVQFPGLCSMAGRAGRRGNPRQHLKHRWPGYWSRSWKAQQAASELIRDIRDWLNANDGTGLTWTSWAVAAALFVDGK